MYTNKTRIYIGIAMISLVFTGCKLPSGLVPRAENKTTPSGYLTSSKDSTNSGAMKVHDFFTDRYLTELIDSALENNQELNIMLQEINMANTQIISKRGKYLPSVGYGVGAGLDKVGQYTRSGAVEASDNIAPGKAFPAALPDYMLGVNASWEVDIWRKLRNERDAAINRYLASIEGKNFMVTHLVAEIASSYYELMAYDNQLLILKENIAIQQNALGIVKQEKDAAQVTELAVRKFEAEVLKNQSRLYYINQAIIETENRINFLVGRFPQPIQRNSQTFIALQPDTILAGFPSQLLDNRPDIRQSFRQLLSTKLEVKAAKAEFYPSLNISANIGMEAFSPAFFVKLPASIIGSLLGGIVGPLINRKAIKAKYYAANAEQIEAVFNYERTILKAYLEVYNQLANVSNLKQSFDKKTLQVAALIRSVEISISLFKSARADYMEVLLTQRDALTARFELVDTKKEQMDAMIHAYQALGGGW